MYVKLYSQILFSSIAEDRKLRHFFTDLLLLADEDGNVLYSDEGIARAIKAPVEEVRDGLQKLSEPDPKSGTPDNDGRRIARIEGRGNGWTILNYKMYREFRSAKEMRKAGAERTRKWREKQKLQKETGELEPKTDPYPPLQPGMKHTNHGEAFFRNAVHQQMNPNPPDEVVPDPKDHDHPNIL